MPNKENVDANLIDELCAIYHAIFSNPCFEQYELYAERLDLLYSEIEGNIVSSEDRIKLYEISRLHEQITTIILSEKEMLSQEIISIEKRKHVVNHYAKLSNSYDVGAFFVDKKTK